MPTERFSLWALAATVTLPFLVPLRAPFFGDAYRAWLTMAFGMGVVTVLLTRPVCEHRGGRKTGPLPIWPLSASALLALASIFILQLLVGSVVYAETNLVGILYVLWATLLMVAVATLRRRVGMTAMVDHAALWVLVGAAACATLGLLSFTGYSAPWLSPAMAGVAYGNLGQANHFAHYLWLGIASLLYLRSRRRLSDPAAAALLILVLLASSLSGSRASLLYASVMVGIAFWRGNSAEKGWAISAAGLYAVALLMAPTMIGHASSMALARLQQDAAFLMADTGGDREWIRPTLLQVAWETFWASPWLGAGLGGFRWASYVTADRQEGWQGAAEHAHNLFANLLAELGMAAPLIVILALIPWLRRLLKRRGDEQSAWLAGMAGVALVHAQLEHPFWYPHFAGIFAIVIAVGDESTIRLPFRRLSMAVIVIAGTAVLVGFGYDLARMESLSRPMTYFETTEQREWRITALAGLRRGSLLAPKIDLALTALIPPTRETLTDRLALCRQSLRYIPSYPNAYTCALLHELAGQHGEAERLWRLASIVFPHQKASYVRIIDETLADDELTPLRPLLAQ